MQMTIAGIQALAREAERRGARIAHLEQGEPEFRTPAHIIEAAKRGLDGGDLYYVPAQGLPELREAVAGRLAADHGLDVHPDQVTITNGATLGLYLALQATVGPGDEVLIGDPGFGQFGSMTELAGARPVWVGAERTAGRFVLRRAALERALTDQTRAIILNSPNNPTGTVYTASELAEIAEVARARKLFVISDEVYDKLVFDGHAHRSIVEVAPDIRDRTILVNSFSKTYAMTGWRLGFNVASADLTARMVRIYHSSARCATAFVQRAGIAALTGSQACVEEMRAIYARRRALILHAIRGVPNVTWAAPEGAFYLLVDVSATGIDPADLPRRLVEEAGVAVAPGGYFGPLGRSHIRLSFATSDAQIEEGIDRLRRLLERAGRTSSGSAS